MDLRGVVVGADGTILDAMRVIDQSGLAVALVCDDDLRVQALVTDGDIRRGLLRGLSLEAPVSTVANPNFVAVSPGTDRIEALRTMQRHRIAAVPVVDTERRLQDLHTLQGVLVGQLIPSWAVVMAGGRGERLGALTDALPKPMLPIGDRPILERIVELLVRHGVQRVFISISYLGSMIMDHFGDGRRFHCRIEYLREDQPLGTGGPLALLPEKPQEPLLVMNGDLLTNINLSRLLRFHRQGEYAGTIVLRDYGFQVPFGVAEVDGAVVRRLVEKPLLEYRINAGIYVLNPEVVAGVPSGSHVAITDVFTRCIEDGRRIGGYLLQENWDDIGLPEEYLRLHRD